MNGAKPPATLVAAVPSHPGVHVGSVVAPSVKVGELGAINWTVTSAVQAFASLTVMV